MLDINTLTKNGKPVYVYNRTGRILEQASPFVLIVKDNNGSSHPIPIPATKYPFLLSGHVSTKILAESMELRNALRKGILELVDPEEGDHIMSDPIAQKAMERSMRRFQSRRRHKHTKDLKMAEERSEYAQRYLPPSVDINAGKFDQTAFEAINKIPQPPKLKIADPRKVENAVEVRPKISQIIWDTNKDVGLVEDAIVDLSSMELTSDDYGYIINEAKSKSLISWAKSELAKSVPNKRKRGRKKAK